MMSAGMCSRALVALTLLSVYVYGENLLGGFQKRDPSDPDVVKAANFAVNTYNQRSKDEYDCKLMKIVSAKSQVVAGMRYVLDVQIGRTDCKKGSTSDTGSCALIQDSKLAQTFMCSFSVVEVPWENKEILESSSCIAQ